MFGFSSFSEAPFSAEALNDYQLSCSAGVYSITGGAATFVYNQALQGGTGSYSISGGSSSFVYNQVIYAGAFSYAITGKSADLLQSRLLNCQAGAYDVVGGEATFVIGKSLVAENGSYVLTGQEATFEYTPVPVFVVESKGGLPKTKRKTKIDREKQQREELEAIVKREFDILDGTYQPEAVEVAKEIILPKIQEIDYTQYQIALAQVNALLLQAKIAAAEYEAELDDEEALLMLL